MMRELSVRGFQNVEGVFSDWIYFAIPVLGLFTINLIGELYLSEVTLLILWAFSRTSQRESLNHLTGPSLVILLFGVLWLLGQIFTDVVRDSVFVDYIRGWSKIALFLVIIIILLGLIDSERKLVLWMTGAAIAAIGRPFQVLEIGEGLPNYWKFGVGYGLALLILCIYYGVQSDEASTQNNGGRRYSFPALLFLGLGIVSFFLNARSVAGISLICSILLYLRARNFNAGTVTPYSLVLVGIVGSAFLIFQIYSVGASSGLFGVEAREKYEGQASSGSLTDILAGGRAEGLVSKVAIADSPIVGHGSWAKNPYYTEMLYRLKVELGARENDDMRSVYSDEGLIPSHSYIFGAWVESGIVGGLFWFVVASWLLFYVLPLSLVGSRPVHSFLLITVPFLLWAILFSPFGAAARVEAGMIIAFSLRAAFSMQRSYMSASRD